FRETGSMMKTLNGGLVTLRNAFIAPEGENPLRTIKMAPTRRAAAIAGLLVGGALTATFGIPALAGTTLAAAPFLLSIDKNTLSQNLPNANPQLSKFKTKNLTNKAEKLFAEIKLQTDKQFVQMAKQAQKDGKALPDTQAYNDLFKQNFRKALAEDVYLSQYAEIVESSLQNETQENAGKITTRLKLQNEHGEIMPDNFTIEIEFADKKAISQWGKLNITPDETLMFVKSKDGSFELVLAKPDGSKRGIYEPFIEGGKFAAEATYYRVLADLQNGSATNDGKTPLFKIRLYSDSAFELLSKLAGITEGFGGLPQSTVSQQATALGMSDPTDLQQNVSHSQLGNVSSVIFTGLQKTLGLKNTLTVGLLGSSVGLGLCAAAVAAPSLEAKIAGLAAGSFILGVFTNGAVKPSNSIFIKENSNDSNTGTARSGFANAGASIGTMTGYLFFPVTTLIALSDIKAFIGLYALAAVVPGIAFASLLLSKTPNYTPIKSQKPGLGGELTAFGKRILNVFPSILHNTVFAFSGGYKERIAEINGKQQSKTREQEYKYLIDEDPEVVTEENVKETPFTEQDNQTVNEKQQTTINQKSNNLFDKISSFFTVAIPAAGSQYLLKMMTLVALYHFAGMMFNSGPGAIIGNYIKSEEGAPIVTALQNSPAVGIALAATLGYFGTKIALALARTVGIIKTQEQTENKTANNNAAISKNEENSKHTKIKDLLIKTKDFFKKNAIPLAGAAAFGLTSGFFPSTALHLTQNLTPTAIGSILTFFTTYLGVYLGRQYLSQLVKTGKLSPQGIIGGSGTLSTISTGLAFIPGLPIGVRMALWGIAGLGFANLAGYENALAIDKYPNEKPAVTMAYTLARLSGAATVFWGDFSKYLAAHGVEASQVYALSLPFAALTLATILNGKYIGTFAQEMSRLINKPITATVVQNKVDNVLTKDEANGIQRTREDLIETVAQELFNAKHKHSVEAVEKEINALVYEAQRDQVRDDVFAKLKDIQSTAPANAQELTYDILMNYEITPLMAALEGKNGTALNRHITEITKAIASHYRITPEALKNIEAKITAEHKAAQNDIRLEVLNKIREMELNRVSGDNENLTPQPAQ
ncbi:MAG: MFS transporter, partial [Elusimicrobiaceae bacterium]|nr:MFS transporter [Elusimicrobiaceae bacterium]